MFRNRIPLYIIVTAIFAFTGCSRSREEIIPSDKMALIVADMYMADQFIALEPAYKGDLDSALLYETVMERYGYTFPDYMKAMEYYLQKGDMVKRIHTAAKESLIKRRDRLAILNADLESYNRAVELFEKKDLNQLWKEPDLRALCHLSRIKVMGEFSITDTTEADTPQNSKWWIYNINGYAIADSLYPPLVRDYLLKIEEEKHDYTNLATIINNEKTLGKLSLSR